MPENIATAPSTQTSSSTPSENVTGNTQGTGMQHQEPKPNVTATPELFEVKVNGKILKMTRDEVISHASMSHAAQSKFEEATRTRKQVERIINTAKSNPIEALMDPSLGLTKEQVRDAFERWYTQEFIEPETLTPEQRKHKENEARLKKYEEQEAQTKRRDEQERQNKETSQQREYLQGVIIDAMEKSGLPKTKFFAERMAFYMRANLRNGWDAPMDFIVSQVKKEHRERLSGITEDSSAEQLIDMLGESIINKIRLHDLKQLRSRRQSQPNQGSGLGSLSPSDKISSSEVTRRLREMRR